MPKYKVEWSVTGSNHVAFQSESVTLEDALARAGRLSAQTNPRLKVITILKEDDHEINRGKF